MNNYFSFKLKFLSFLLIILVVFLHSYNISDQILTFKTELPVFFNIFIQEFVSQGITRIAVPLFFMISSYLYFRNFNGSVQIYVEKIKKRINTLLIPYILWSLLGLSVFFLLQLIPGLSIFFKNELIINFSFKDYLEVIFINPIPFQLWFIRDLFILMLLSPLIYHLLKKSSILVLISASIFWIINVKLYFISNEALLFFLIGSSFALNRITILLEPILFKYSQYLSLFWLFAVLTNTCLSIFNLLDVSITNVIHRINIIFGIASLWLLYDYFMSRNKSLINSISPYFAYSFFIYAFHIPFLGMLQKLLFYFWGYNDSISLSIFLISPIITIAIAIIIATFLKQKFTKSYNFLTGNR